MFVAPRLAASAPVGTAGSPSDPCALRQPDRPSERMRSGQGDASGAIVRSTGRRCTAPRPGANRMRSQDLITRAPRRNVSPTVGARAALSHTALRRYHRLVGRGGR